MKFTVSRAWGGIETIEMACTASAACASSMQPPSVMTLLLMHCVHVLATAHRPKTKRKNAATHDVEVPVHRVLIVGKRRHHRHHQAPVAADLGGGGGRSRPDQIRSGQIRIRSDQPGDAARQSRRAAQNIQAHVDSPHRALAVCLVCFQACLLLPTYFQNPQAQALTSTRFSRVSVCFHSMPASSSCKQMALRMVTGSP